MPNSRGYSHIRSKNPFDNPYILPFYYNDPDDQASAEYCFQYVEYFAQNISEITGQYLPGTSDPELVEYYIATQGYDSHKSSGTVPMGNTPNPGVVDPNLVVFSFANLRVADASVIPVPVSRGLAAVTFMIGMIAASNAIELGYTVDIDPTHGLSVTDVDHGFVVVQSPTTGDSPTCALVGARDLFFNADCSSCECMDAAAQASTLGISSWWVTETAGGCNSMSTSGPITTSDCSDTNYFLCMQKNFKP